MADSKKGIGLLPGVRENKPDVKGDIHASGGVVNLGVQGTVSVENREKAVESTREKEEMLQKSHRENKECTSKKGGDGGSKTKK